MENSVSTLYWRVIPKNPPAILRNCPKCKHQTHYQCSYKFRVNANGKSIDIWLIYKCENCDSTWNMEILSRVNPDTIEKDRYEGFLSNDRDLINLIIYNKETYAKTKAVVDYKSMGYQIQGGAVPFSQLKLPVELKIQCVFPLMLRLDKFLSETLELSRSTIKIKYKSGQITALNCTDSLKLQVKNGISIQIKQQ